MVGLGWAVVDREAALGSPIMMRYLDEAEESARAKRLGVWREGR
jgi:endonuclease YncB( thermonuclease family)